MAENRVLLEQFEVSGFKNLTQPIIFGPLGQINVIHGPNNVGKSNLLQAIDLSFRGMDQVQMQVDTPIFFSLPDNLGYTSQQMFNLSNPSRIQLDVKFGPYYIGPSYFMEGSFEHFANQAILRKGAFN